MTLNGIYKLCGTEVHLGSNIQEDVGVTPNVTVVLEVAAAISCRASSHVFPPAARHAAQLGNVGAPTKPVLIQHAA